MNIRKTICFIVASLILISCNGNSKVEGEWVEDVCYGTMKIGTLSWSFYKDGTFRHVSDNSRIGIDHIPTGKYDLPQLRMKGSTNFITGTYKVKGNKIFLTQNGNTVVWHCEVQGGTLVLGTDAGGYYHLKKK